jgi:putative nucleotidyltransferase with HDIG domain
VLSRRLRLAGGRLLLAWRLSRWLPPAARSLWDRLAGNGYATYLVGGAVRDLLLGIPPRDWDFTTAASPAEMLALFPEGKVVGSSRGHPTVLIPMDGEVLEVTPFRGDSLAADLARRDFTLNAMALGRDGALHDPWRGREDLSEGRMRAVGDPGARIAEDPLRMLRAVRLAAQFGCALDEGLAAAIRAQADALERVAPERIGHEFGRLLITERPAWGMQQLRELGLLTRFAPELLEMYGVPQNQFHRYPVWEHALLALALVPPVLHLRLAALLHDVGKPRTVSVDAAGNRHFYRHEQVGAEMADALLRRLRFDGETRRRVVHLVRFHMDLHLDEAVSDAAIRRMIRRIGLEHMDDLVQLRRADRLASGMREGELSPETLALLRRIREVLARDAALKVTDLKVNGHDVVQIFGRPPGPYVGQVLQTLLQDVLEDPERNQRAWLLGRLAALRQQWHEK